MLNPELACAFGSELLRARALTYSVSLVQGHNLAVSLPIPDNAGQDKALHPYGKIVNQARRASQHMRQPL